MEKYFNEKELGIMNYAWENRKSVYIHRYKGLSNKRDWLAPGSLKQSAKWYRNRQEFMNAVLEDCLLLGYIECA